MHYFKLFIRVKSTQDEKMRFFLGNQLKLTQVELLSFFYFKSVQLEITADAFHIPFKLFCKEFSIKWEYLMHNN